MSLNNRVKEVTLKITLHHVLRNAHKSIERTCRNAIALGKDLSNENFSPDTLSHLQNELREKLPHMNEEQIKAWLVQKFHLY